jgi:tRNA(fMet)-specific endonuclease VapC
VIGLRVRGAGRTPAARAYDAMIAAIAISNDLPLHTCNPRDFAGIEELTVVAVPHPHH